MRLELARFNKRLTNVQEGAIEGCIEYNAAIALMTCKSFLALNRITIAQLFKWYANRPLHTHAKLVLTLCDLNEPCCRC